MNSLFKVLFNFPSRYLFAIGLGVIFSLTWSLPRTLSCTPKQLDSRGKPAQLDSRLTGLSPSAGRGPSQGGLGLAVASRGGSPKHHIPRDRGGRQFGAGLCPFHSPLLRASQLFSFPPLINMLKFGGSPCLLSGRKYREKVETEGKKLASQQSLALNFPPRLDFILLSVTPPCDSRPGNTFVYPKSLNREEQHGKRFPREGSSSLES